jgi:glycosyltransferase involved in cell wall biosynthesis
LVVALVPAYNEEHYVASVLVRLMKVVDGVIVCDDGSVDLTGDIAEAMGATVVRHIWNMGYGAHDISDSVLTIGVGVGNV